MSFSSTDFLFFPFLSFPQLVTTVEGKPLLASPEMERLVDFTYPVSCAVDGGRSRVYPDLLFRQGALS